jgi:hypothetical protein
LEFRSELELEAEDKAVAKLVLDSILTNEYQLPQLKPASSYDEYRRRNNELAPRIMAAAKGWSSPTRAKAQRNLEDTNT